MNFETCYKAMLSRDHRFDGKFFIGVKTTGIYCRPICPAKPKKENISFFTTALDAERGGYRPCMRCRPESAPGSAAWKGKSVVVERALKFIESHPQHGLSDDEFAQKFGMTARHLRRLFVDELGLTPKQILTSKQLNFARKLITESSLSITEIALSSGFRSVRRFNDAFKLRFHKSPRDFRNARLKKDQAPIVLKLSYRPPLAWDQVLQFYKNHLIDGLEEIQGDSYTRVILQNSQPARIAVRDCSEASYVELSIYTSNYDNIFEIVKKVRQMLDLDLDPMELSKSFRANPDTKKMWKAEPGLRIAKSWDPFESAVTTVLGQLVSMNQARALVSQLVLHYGDEGVDPVSNKTIRLFPSPKKLLRASMLKVRTTERRRSAIRDLARFYLSGELKLSEPEDLPGLRSKLKSISGIGPWTVEYILLRGVGDTDAFPKDDLILKRAVESYTDLATNDFVPWRSYLAVYLWSNYGQ